jgi:DNA-binding transcriptional ArsR family regulator
LPFVHHLYIFRDVKVSNQIETCAERRVDEAKVALAASLVDVEEATALAQMFRLLGDPTRVRILFALLEAGELCVCDIAAVVETTETKVSQAMSLLRTAGVVRNRRDGRNIFYRLDDAHVRMVLDISREHLAHHPGTEG